MKKMNIFPTFPRLTGLVLLCRSVFKVSEHDLEAVRVQRAQHPDRPGYRTEVRTGGGAQLSMLRRQQDAGTSCTPVCKRTASMWTWRSPACWWDRPLREEDPAGWWWCSAGRSAPPETEERLQEEPWCVGVSLCWWESTRTGVTVSFFRAELYWSSERSGSPLGNVSSGDLVAISQTPSYHSSGHKPERFSSRKRKAQALLGGKWIATEEIKTFRYLLDKSWNEREFNSSPCDHKF